MITSRSTWIALLPVCLLGAACPGRGGSTVDSTPPPFVVGDGATALPEPPPPGADKQGLAYLEQVYPRFREPWQAFINDCRLRLPAGDPLNDESLRVVISFGVRPDGSVQEVQVAAPSGKPDFDEVALEIVRDAETLPAPAEELAGDDGVVAIHWAFQRDQRLAGVATADIHRVEWPPERAIPAFIATGLVRRAAERLARAVDAPTAITMGRAVALAAVRAALDERDETVRAAGVRAATVSRASELGPALERVARTAVDVGVRRDAIRALGTVRAASARTFLLSVVDGSAGVQDAGSVAAAAHALGELGAGNSAGPHLLAALSGKNDERRRLALAVMSEVPVPEAVDELQALATTGDNRALRAAACSALGVAAAGSKDPAAAMATLRKLLATNDATVRAACARGIGALARAGTQNRATYWKVVELIKDRDDAVRAAAAHAAAHLDPAKFGGELYLLRAERSPAVLEALASGLAVVTGPAAYQRLTGLLKSEAIQVRRAAARSLARRPEQQAAAVVAGLIADPDLEMKLLAASTIGSIQALDAHADAPELPLRQVVLARIMAARGQKDGLAEMAAAIAGSESVAGRAVVAGAWLAAG
ncbi:MAG TPA: TonB family protein [Kofleriaceae bacterium]|nr:TonB family protein [Kofleriaceae bacterium]